MTRPCEVCEVCGAVIPAAPGPALRHVLFGCEHPLRALRVELRQQWADRPLYLTTILLAAGVVGAGVAAVALR